MVIRMYLPFVSEGSDDQMARLKFERRRHQRISDGVVVGPVVCVDRSVVLFVVFADGAM